MQKTIKNTEKRNANQVLITFADGSTAWTSQTFIDKAIEKAGYAVINLHQRLFKKATVEVEIEFRAAGSTYETEEGTFVREEDSNSVTSIAMVGEFDYSQVDWVAEENVAKLAAISTIEVPTFERKKERVRYEVPTPKAKKNPADEVLENSEK